MQLALTVTKDNGNEVWKNNSYHTAHFEDLGGKAGDCTADTKEVRVQSPRQHKCLHDLQILVLGLVWYHGTSFCYPLYRESCGVRTMLVFD